MNIFFPSVPTKKGDNASPQSGLADKAESMSEADLDRSKLFSY